MSEAVSALNHAEFDGICRIEEIGLQGMITVRGDLASKALKSAVKSATGLNLPDVRECTSADGMAVSWMSPDELLVMCPYARAETLAAEMTDALKNVHSLVANVSDARASFVLTGAMMREVLAKIAPVDLSPDVFTPGMFRRTRFAQVAAAFWLKDNETAQVVCFRSVAPYMMSLLSAAAQPDSEVGYFQ